MKIKINASENYRSHYYRRHEQEFYSENLYDAGEAYQNYLITVLKDELGKDYDRNNIQVFVNTNDYTSSFEIRVNLNPSISEELASRILEICADLSNDKFVRIRHTTNWDIYSLDDSSDWLIESYLDGLFTL